MKIHAAKDAFETDFGVTVLEIGVALDRMLNGPDDRPATIAFTIFAQPTDARLSGRMYSSGNIEPAQLKELLREFFENAVKTDVSTD